MVFEAEQRVIKKELERQERRLARERRRKENELKALRDEIKKNFIKKGEIKENMIAWDIFDVNGNYEKGKNFAGALGGQLLQFCIVLQSMMELSNQQPGGEKKQPADIMSSPLLVTFLLAFVKELKNDSGLLVQITNTTSTLIENFKYGLDQLPKWKEDELR